MTNLRPLKRLERIQTELRKVLLHMSQYDGVPKGREMDIDTEACAICETAARIVDLSHASLGLQRPMVCTKVRKALGFTYP